MNVKFISLGSRCSTASILKKLHLKSESYPFDWLVSKLDTIRDCIESSFEHFLNKSNYISAGNSFDVDSHILINTYYEKHALSHLETVDTFIRLKLAMNHFYITDDTGYLYYERCIIRFKNILTYPGPKVTIYIHPILSRLEYEQQQYAIITQITEFDSYIHTKTENIYGIYFILVKDEDRDNPSIEIVNNHQFTIYTIYVNKHFVDTGGIFEGEYGTELKMIEDIIHSKSDNAYRATDEEIISL
jgi:hypothetical protein